MGAEPQDTEAYSFRRRALAEAARYGSDPYVFVRELLQNARDAGAGRVEIEVSRDGARGRFACRDDGSGMTYEHARRYLFALYASSKEESTAEAGKFGIGFWSVLRLAPDNITVRSRAASHDAWQVTIDGRLERVMAAASTLRTGTEVVLEWPASPGEDLAEVIFDATRRYGRFLTRRDDAEVPLAITVNGRGANAELALPPPSAAFRGKGFRGVVGLGAAPEVELFAQGLFVRATASLQDLRGAGEIHERASAEDALAELPSLAPQVLIDSAELDLLLARSDARYDRHLKRILRAAEKALGRLITRQLQTLRPQPWYRLALGALRDRIEPFLGWHLAAAGAAGLLLGLALLWWLPLRWLPRPTGPGAPPPATGREAATSPVEAAAAPPALAAPATGSASDSGPSDWPPPELASAITGGGPTAADAASPDALRRSALHRYFDLAASYRGPRTDALAEDPSRLAMLYEPASAVPFFTALVIEDPSAGSWQASPTSGRLPRYPPAPCRTGCLTVRLLVAPRPGPLRLPIPTGHRLDASSVRLDGELLEVYETRSGEAVVRHEPTRRGLLEYHTGPAPVPPDRRGPASRRRTVAAAALPAELDAVAADLRRHPLRERAQLGLDYVARRVVYDRSPAGPAGAHGDSLPAPGGDFVADALATGSGDCDVQNGVLAALLRSAGVDARLAVGYVGLRGTAASGLHAWVEVTDELGNRHVADASVTPGGEDFAVASDLGEPPYEMPAGSLMTPRPLAAGVADGPAAPARAAFLALLLAVGSIALWLRRRFASSAPPDAGENLAALLGGALRHPEAFAGLPALFHGRFVPLVGRSAAVSLAQARRLARKNRLFRSSTGSTLARRAAARGVPVIDAATAEGRVLSLALGAIDVDHWSSTWTRSEESDLCHRINRRLQTADAPWRLRQATGTAPLRAAAPWTEIALEDLGLGRRLIVLELGAPEFAPVRGLLPERPRAAAFTMIDVLVHRFELTGRERARILAAFARPAVGEAADREVA